MNKYFILFIGILLTGSLFSSCKKDYCQCTTIFQDVVIEQNDIVREEGFTCAIFEASEDSIAYSDGEEIVFQTKIVCVEVIK